MTQQTIGIGSSANDGTGDTPRAAFTKVNANFTELYSGYFATITTQAAARTALGILPVANGGTGTASPALVAGTGVTITGSWPNQTINASGGGSFSGGAIAAPIQISGGSQATDNPIENNTQTWTGTGTFTGYRMNITDSGPSAAGSMLIDLQVGGTSKFNVDKSGKVYAGAGAWQTPSYSFTGNTNTGISNFSGVNIISAGASIATFSGFGIVMPVGCKLGWSSTSDDTGAAPQTTLTTRGIANLQFGAQDAAAPVAQTLTAQSVVAGTSNTAGANLTVQGSAGTGTGAGGSIIFQTAAAGSTGTAQNAFGTALTLAADKSATFTGSGSFGGQLSVTGNTNLANVVASGAGNFGSFGFQFDSFFTLPVSGTVAQKNGTASQSFRLYGTASGGNDAYAELNHSTGGAFTLATKQTGSGAASSISLDTPSSVRVIRSAANTGGNLTIVGGAGSDIAGSIGSSWALGVIGPDGTTYKAGIRADGFVAGTAIGTSDSNTAAFDQVNTPKGVKVNSTSMFTFSSAGAWWQTIDLALARNAAGVAEINNGVAGTYRDLKLRNLIFSDGTQLATSPARALLTTITPTAVASIAYTSIPSGYSKFEIEFDNVTNANGGANEAPLIALSANNGTTYDSSQCGAANTGLSGAMYGRISIAPVGVTANKIAEGAATQGTVYWAIGGKWTSQTGVTNAIRFAWSGGSNFVAQGAIRIYGIV